MNIRSIITALTAAATLAFGATTTASASPAQPSTHEAHAILAPQIPAVSTNVDVKTSDGSYLTDEGHNVPYFWHSGDGGTDFSEVGCQIIGGRNWCRIEDQSGLCLNAASNLLVYADACIQNDTLEQWARPGSNGAWKYENQHFGKYLDAYTAGCIPGGLNCENAYLTSSGLTFSLVAS